MRIFSQWSLSQNHRIIPETKIFHEKTEYVLKVKEDVHLSTNIYFLFLEKSKNSFIINNAHT